MEKGYNIGAQPPLKAVGWNNQLDLRRVLLYLASESNTYFLQIRLDGVVVYEAHQLDEVNK
jgi:hypothetical protein